MQHTPPMKPSRQLAFQQSAKVMRPCSHVAQTHAQALCHQSVTTQYPSRDLRRAMAARGDGELDVAAPVQVCGRHHEARQPEVLGAGGSLGGVKVNCRSDAQPG